MTFRAVNWDGTAPLWTQPDCLMNSVPRSSAGGAVRLVPDPWLGGVLDDGGADLRPERHWQVVPHIREKEETGIWDQCRRPLASAWRYERVIESVDHQGRDPEASQSIGA